MASVLNVEKVIMKQIIYVMHVNKIVQHAQTHQIVSHALTDTIGQLIMAVYAQHALMDVQHVTKKDNVIHVSNNITNTTIIACIVLQTVTNVLMVQLVQAVILVF